LNAIKINIFVNEARKEHNKTYFIIRKLREKRPFPHVMRQWKLDKQYYVISLNAESIYLKCEQFYCKVINKIKKNADRCFRDTG